MKKVMLMLIVGTWMGSVEMGQARAAISNTPIPPATTLTPHVDMTGAGSPVGKDGLAALPRTSREIQLAEVEAAAPTSAPAPPRAKARGTATPAKPVTDTSLQTGILEEDLNIDLNAAIQSYQSLVTQFDGQRATVANAIFRLGECYRKLGKTNEANLQYSRILREFADQPVLAQLARKQLGEPAAAGPSETAGKPRRDRNATPEAQAGRIEYLKKLMQDSPDLFYRPDTLREAVGGQQLDVVRFLLENKAEVNAPYGNQGETELLLATKMNSIPLIELLLANGADPNIGRTRPLSWAAGEGNKAVAELLLKAKADVNGTGDDGFTALHHAVIAGYKSMADLLLQYGADLNFRNKQNVKAENFTLIPFTENFIGPTFSSLAPIHCAVWRERLAMLEWLCSHKADLNIKEGLGKTPLYLAVSKGSPEAVQILLAAGADASIPNQNGQSVLMLAIESDQAGIVDVLLSKGLDPNQKYGVSNGIEEYPLCQAASKGKALALEVLLKHQAKIDIDDNRALYLAIQNGTPAVVEKLLAAGAPVNAMRKLNDRLFAPLHFAILKGSTFAVNTLIKAKADADLALENGEGPLHLAVLMCNRDMVTTLLASRANLDAVDKSGDSPLSLALMARDGFEVMRVLAPQLEEAQNQPGSASAGGYTFFINSGAPVYPQLAPGDLHTTASTLPQVGVRGLYTSALRNPQYDEIIQLLVQHGAREDADRGYHIYFKYGTNPAERVFTRDPRQVNKFTLFELAYFAMRLHYVVYPDWTHLVIHRLGSSNGEPANLEIDLLARLTATEVKDENLAWGDRVEIREQIHQVNEEPYEFPAEALSAMLDRLARKVVVNVGQKENSLDIAWLAAGRNVLSGPSSNWPADISGRYYQEMDARRNLVPGAPPNGANTPNPSIRRAGVRARKAAPLLSCWMGQVIRNSNVLLNTSDVTRVRVLHASTPGGERKELVYNLNEVKFPDDLWLEEGDVVTVPDKEK